MDQHPVILVWLRAAPGNILTGMVAQGRAGGGRIGAKDPPCASTHPAGVFLHGLAGDLARDHLGEHSLIATDLLSICPPHFAPFRR